MKTDLRLQQDVLAELQWEPAVHAARIGVEVRSGVVTLAGEVSSYLEKIHAKRAARRVAGVRAVACELHVKLEDTNRRTDAELAETACNVLSWTTALPTDAVKVLVEDGWITLTGRVDWQFQRQAAVDSVRHLSGVTGISNQIAIEPEPKAVMVKSDIEAAIQRRAADDAKAIQVEVRGGDVTLSGNVHSWAERELAKRSAWSSPGVRQVIDHIQIV